MSVWFPPCHTSCGLVRSAVAVFWISLDSLRPYWYRSSFSGLGLLCCNALTTNQAVTTPADISAALTICYLHLRRVVALVQPVSPLTPRGAPLTQRGLGGEVLRTSLHGFAAWSTRRRPTYAADPDPSQPWSPPTLRARSAGIRHAPSFGTAGGIAASPPLYGGFGLLADLPLESWAGGVRPKGWGALGAVKRVPGAPAECGRKARSRIEAHVEAGRCTVSMHSFLRPQSQGWRHCSK